MPKIAVDKVKVGDLIGTPGDKKVRTVWGCVSKIERDGNFITFESPDWASESAKKYKGAAATGVYFARKGEKVDVKPGACKLKKP